MSEPSVSASPTPGREFAFSRIAGASPSEYAAVSGSAVAAVVLSLFSWLSLFWVWGLVAPGLALLLAGLSWYYIATSAGTLTGRGVVAVAIGISLLVGGAGGVIQFREYRAKVADDRTIHTMVDEAIGHIRAARWDDLYDQLSPAFHDGVHASYWRYAWNKWIEENGQVRLIEGDYRTRFLARNTILVTLNLHVLPPGESDEDVPPEQLPAVSLRMVYRHYTPEELEAYYQQMDELLGRADDHGHGDAVGEADGPGPAPHAVAQPGWWLNSMPYFINPLPPPYGEALVWPAPGDVQFVITRPGSDVPRTLIAPPASPPTTQPDERIQATILQSPLVPPLGNPPLQGWLTRRKPAPRHAGHQH